MYRTLYTYGCLPGHLPRDGITLPAFVPRCCLPFSPNTPYSPDPTFPVCPLLLQTTIALMTSRCPCIVCALPISHSHRQPPLFLPPYPSHIPPQPYLLPNTAPFVFTGGFRGADRGIIRGIGWLAVKQTRGLRD